jgi:hypothetical protein
VRAAAPEPKAKAGCFARELRLGEPALRGNSALPGMKTTFSKALLSDFAR